jgi:hypothetical protein
LNEKRNVETYKNNFVNPEAKQSAQYSYRKNMNSMKNFMLQYTNLFEEKDISENMCPFILCKEILPIYWLETQPINHNKELDAYTISVHK